MVRFASLTSPIFHRIVKIPGAYGDSQASRRVRGGASCGPRWQRRNILWRQHSEAAQETCRSDVAKGVWVRASCSGFTTSAGSRKTRQHHFCVADGARHVTMDINHMCIVTANSTPVQLCFFLSTMTLHGDGIVSSSKTKIFHLIFFVQVVHASYSSADQPARCSR